MTKNRMYAVAIVCCFIMIGCKKSPVADREAEYTVMTVGATDRELTENYSATIRGRQDIDIYPQVSGTIARVCIKEGENVQQGQTLFVIDQVPYQAALQMAEANTEAARASVATAKLVYESKQALFEENVISRFDLSTARNQLLTAQAQLAQAEAQVVNARNNLSYTTVKSPSAGVIGTLPYRRGALVGPSLPKPLTTVSDNSDMYVYFSMTENQLLALTRKHGSVKEAIDALPEVRLQLNDGSLYDKEGYIETISGVIDPSTGSVSLRAVFPNCDGLLRSGASGNIILPVWHTGCLVIPQAATYEVQDKIFVYKITDGKTKSARIEVSPVNDGKEYIVTAGLSAGELIVSEGVGLLREDTPVRIKKQQTGGTTACN